MRYIETEEHLFFYCNLAIQLWQQLTQMVMPLFRTRPNCLSVALAKQSRVRDDYDDCEEVAQDVWHMLRAVAPHFIWTDGNQCLFYGLRPTPTLPALSVIFTTFSARVWFFNRRHCGVEDKLSLAKIVRAMKSLPVLNRFTVLHPKITSVRSPI